LIVLHERAAGLQATRGDVLVRARRVCIKEKSVTGKLGSSATPVTGELGVLPEVSNHRARHPENGSVVEEWKKARRHVYDGKQIRWNRAPLICSCGRSRFSNVAERPKTFISLHMSVCQKQTHDRCKPKISKLHPRGHDSDLIPRRLRPASSQASAKNFYKSKRGCSIANMLISIGSDNLDAQFREVLLHRRGKVSVGELCSAYGIRWCRCTTLTVRLVRNARLTRTSADVAM